MLQQRWAVNFLDDSARVKKPRNILLEGRAFVGPFAKLLAGADAPIKIGEQSNAQDNVTIVAESRHRRRHGRLPKRPVSRSALA